MNKKSSFFELEIWCPHLVQNEGPPHMAGVQLVYSIRRELSLLLQRIILASSFSSYDVITTVSFHVVTTVGSIRACPSCPRQYPEQACLGRQPASHPCLHMSP